MILALQEGFHCVGDLHVVEIGVTELGPDIRLVDLLSVVLSPLQVSNLLNQDIKRLGVHSLLPVDDQNFLIESLLQCNLGNIDGIVVIKPIDVIHDSVPV